jgi:hypothetical protein
VEQAAASAGFVPAWPGLVAVIYEQADAPLRAQLLECLLQPLGMLARVAVASGAFSAVPGLLGDQPSSVQAASALNCDAEQLQELARFALEIDPGILVRLDTLLTNRRREGPAFDTDAACHLFQEPLRPYPLPVP